jgi:hypothetical protein
MNVTTLCTQLSTDQANKLIELLTNLPAPAGDTVPSASTDEFLAGVTEALNALLVPIGEEGAELRDNELVGRQEEAAFLMAFQRAHTAANRKRLNRWAYRATWRQEQTKAYGTLRGQLAGIGKEVESEFRTKVLALPGAQN